MELEDQFRLTDSEAKALILKIAKCNSPSDFQQLDTDKRNSCIYRQKKKGLSIRQISRLTGISKKIVEINIK